MKKTKKLWFKRRKFGWGWTPCSWEGWTFIGAYLVAVILLSTLFKEQLEQDNPWLFLGVILITILIVIVV